MQYFNYISLCACSNYYVRLFHSYLITWLNESLSAHVYEKFYNPIQSLSYVWVINKWSLGLNDTNSASTYNMISPYKKGYRLREAAKKSFF